MFVLLLCAVLSEYAQPGIITQAYLSLSDKDRTYKDAPTNIFGQAFITLFRIGTMALAVAFCLYSGGTFSFTAYAAVCGIVLGVLVIKMFCNKLIDFTFDLSHRFGDFYEHYGNIATMGVVVLFPLLLILLRVGTPLACRWGLGIVTGAFLLLWIYRSARQCVSSPLALLYLVLYMATLEVLPLATVYYLSAKMMTIL